MIARYITATVLLILLAIVSYLPVWIIILCAEVVVFYAAYEWSKFTKMNETNQGITLLLFFGLSIMLVSANIGVFDSMGFFGVFKLFAFLNQQNIIILYKIFNYLGLVFWLGIAPYFLYKKTKIIVGAYAVLFGSVLLAIAIFAFNYLITSSKGILLVAILIPVIADVFAYFVGKLFGSRKFTIISPNKTLEGLAGGLTAVAIIGGYLVTYFVGYPWFISIFVALIVGVASVVGDLFISLGKRWAGVKDTGGILPGHGGVLDRIDSHIAAMPVFATILLIF